MEARHEHDEPTNAPLLGGIPKVDPFVVPQNFFERFPHQVQASIAERERKPSLGNWLTWRWRYAAVPALVAALVIVLYQTSDTPGTPTVNSETYAVYDDEVLFLDTDEHDLIALQEHAPLPFQELAGDWHADELASYLHAQELPLDLLIELQ